MLQTFDDLYQEHVYAPKPGLFGFVLWTIIETVFGLTKEHIHVLLEGKAMKRILTQVQSPALISLLIIIPFLILELINRRNFHEGFPLALFIFLWLLSLSFIFILTPIIRNIRAGINLWAHPLVLLLRLVFMAFIVFLWAGTVIDQLPCFLGVSFCD